MANIEHLGRYDSGVSVKKVLFWFIVLVILVVLVVAYFTFSKTEIVLIPKTEIKELRMEIIINKNASGIDHDRNLIRGVVLVEHSSGVKEINDIPLKRVKESSRGQITIFNGYTRAQGFKKGDILVSECSQKKAVLEEDLIVYRNQTKEVAVRSVEKGADAVIKPCGFTFEKYNEYMNEKVQVKSEKAFQGGIREAKLITENDLEIYKRELIGELEEENLEKLRLKLREGEFFEESLLLNDVSNFKASVEPPAEQDSLRLSLDLKSAIPVFQENDFYALIEKELKDLRFEDQEYLGFAKEDLKVSNRRVSSERGEAVLDVTAYGKYRPKLSTKLFNREEIKGYNESALKNYYDDFEELEGVRIKFWPAFRKTVPDMDNRIIIKIEE
ncbi:MAG: hypothetical protein GF347_01965 [Candidatus Moranbacteria bacterium]|nr:hypothetical protein [Candidatus Moranbacteria bacterium]